jgi:Zn-finger nucleic acid-binding protein
MKTCPCCYYSLLRHLRHNDMYWYCPHCRAEMPDLSQDSLLQSRLLLKDKLKIRSRNLVSLK